MAYPPEKGANSFPKIPNPDLNPLQNVTLSRNMGRWAQVYFTSPPEKREEAVLQLLRELEGGAPTSPAQREPANGNRYAEQKAAESVLSVCPACGQNNEGQWRYCAMCGAILAAAAQEPDPPPSLLVSEIAVLQPPIVPTAKISADDAGTGSAPVEAIAEAEHSVATNESGVEWLRGKELTKAASRLESSERNKRYLLAVFVLLVAALVYLQRAGHKAAQPGTLRTQSPAAQQPVQPVAAAVSTQQPTTPPPVSTPVGPPSSATKSEPGQPPTAASWKSADPTQVSTGSTPPVAPVAPQGDSGSLEWLQGQRYLKGKTAPRDSTEAAKWLWKAVAKQNTRALVSLASLYAQGDGVPKSCDQARVLLSAAAQKGSEQATAKLKELENAPCQ